MPGRWMVSVVGSYPHRVSMQGEMVGPVQC